MMKAGFPPQGRRAFPRFWTPLLAIALLLAVTAPRQPALAAPELDERGLHIQPWFLSSFMDLAEDRAQAQAAGKRLILLWELKGCPYCKLLHEVTLADPEVRAFMQENFETLQLDLRGPLEVTDFDGEQMGERALGRKYNIRLTPTLQFFPLDGEDLSGVAPKEREIFRMPGYMEPADFMQVLQDVARGRYD